MRACGMAVATGLACLGLLAPGGSAEPKKETPRPAEVWKSAEAITVDGVLDELAWKAATPVAADYVWGKVGQKSKEPRMKAWYTWDEHYLYLAYETFDSNLVALGTGEKKGPKDNQTPVASIHHEKEKVDVVEFFLSFGDERIFWEVHHNALNHFNDILITVADEKWPVARSSLFRFGIHFGTG